MGVNLEILTEMVGWRLDCGPGGLTLSGRGGRLALISELDVVTAVLMSTAALIKLCKQAYRLPPINYLTYSAVVVGHSDRLSFKSDYQI